MGVAKRSVLGLAFANVTLSEAADHLRSRIPCGRPYVAFTPNPEMMERAARDAGFCCWLHRADVLFADGVGVVWASRILGQPLPGVVPGIDLMHALFRRADAQGLSVFLLGTTEENVSAAAERLKCQYAGVRLVGYQHGFFADTGWPAVRDMLQASGPDIVICGMGVPKDQQFLIQNRSELPPSVYLAVGGALDVLAGVVSRAPTPFRRLRMEWLYRLLTNPTRFRRQLALPRFVCRVLRMRVTGRTSLR